MASERVTSRRVDGDCGGGVICDWRRRQIKLAYYNMIVIGDCIMDTLVVLTG